MVKSFRDKFPPPYRAEIIPGGYQEVDAAGNELAFIYTNPGTLEVNERFKMTMAEAKVWAKQIAKLGDR